MINLDIENIKKYNLVFKPINNIKLIFD